MMRKSKNCGVEGWVRWWDVGGGGRLLQQVLEDKESTLPISTQVSFLSTNEILITIDTWLKNAIPEEKRLRHQENRRQSRRQMSIEDLPPPLQEPQSTPDSRQCHSHQSLWSACDRSSNSSGAINCLSGAVRSWC